MPFSTLGLSPALCTPLARMGYSQPTPVQTQSIPIVLKGNDLLARAQTGTGKTAAFGLPMIERLLVSGRSTTSRRPRGLVLVPTRELAVQVHQALLAYGAPVRLRATAIFGGMAMRPQVQALQRGTDIIIATPGRLIDHIEHRTVDLSGVEILTLDEADRMLDMGFLPPMRRVIACVPKQRQTLLLSATLSTEVVGLAAEFMRNPVRVDVSTTQSMAPTVTHRLHPVAESQKTALLAHVLTQAPVGQALVFCRTKHGSDRLAESLADAGVRASVIHGNKSQGARTRALADFKAGRVAVLVATDIAARGLDIAQLPLVVNHDLPLVAQDYIHRIGRTGRAGLAGRAVSLVSHADRPLLRDIERLVQTPLEEVIVPGFEPRSAPRSTDDSARRRHGHRPQGNFRARRAPASRSGFDRNRRVRAQER